VRPGQAQQFRIAESDPGIVNMLEPQRFQPDALAMQSGLSAKGIVVQHTAQ
jgi:hypothetical protein